MKHSSKIALAIATSAPAIKAEEMCGSESSEKQPKKKGKKEKKARQKGNGGRAVTAVIAPMPGRGTEAPQVWGLQGSEEKRGKINNKIKCKSKPAFICTVREQLWGSC